MLEILGRPVTKKNSQQLVPVRRGAKVVYLPLPSKQYRAWEAAALPQARLLRHHLLEQGFIIPIAEPVNVTALFFRHHHMGDLNNYTAALADMLEKAGVVADDRFIQGWDGSRLCFDKKRPRVEFTVARLGA